MIGDLVELISFGMLKKEDVEAKLQEAGEALGEMVFDFVQWIKNFDMDETVTDITNFGDFIATEMKSLYDKGIALYATKFPKAAAALDEFVGEVGSFTSWLFGEIKGVYNQAIDNLSTELFPSVEGFYH